MEIWCIKTKQKCKTLLRLIKSGWHETSCILLLKNCTDWPNEGALIKCHNVNTNVTRLQLRFWQNKDRLYSLSSDVAAIPLIGQAGGALIKGQNFKPWKARNGTPPMWLGDTENMNFEWFMEFKHHLEEIMVFKVQTVLGASKIWLQILIKILFWFRLIFLTISIFFFWNVSCP